MKTSIKLFGWELRLLVLVGALFLFSVVAWSIWTLVSVRTGLEWVGEDGSWNGHMRKPVVVEGKTMLFYRFSDYWNTNDIYRIEAYADNQIMTNTVVSVSIRKKCQDSLQLIGQFDLSFSASNDGRSKAVLELPREFTPIRRQEILELEFVSPMFEGPEDSNAKKTKFLFKAQKAYYLPTA